MKRTLMIAIAALTIPAAASATTMNNLLVNGSFEMDPGVVSQGVSGHGAGATFADMPTTGSSWGIWTSGIAGWRTSDNGIEIQTGRTLNPDLTPDDGQYYAELDTLNNTSIFQDVFLNAGTHMLSFAYAPRMDNRNTNRMRYRVTGGGTSLLSGIAAERYRGGDREWSTYDVLFDVATAGTYTLRFDGRGASDSLGGLLDDVAISAVPLPAGMLLLGTALGGLGLARRRKKA